MPSPEEFQAEINRLQSENARLSALLDSHDIPWKRPVEKSPVPLPRQGRSIAFSTDGKVALFRRRFQGRMDVYPIRWESARSDKSGYSPACGNEWKRGVCQKPHIKCSQCDCRELLPVTDSVLLIAQIEFASIITSEEKHLFSSRKIDTLQLIW